MSDENTIPATTKVRIDTVKAKYPKVTAAQRKEIDKGVDMDEVKKGIQARQLQVRKFVRRTFTGEAPPVFYDKGE